MAMFIQPQSFHGTSDHCPQMLRENQERQVRLAFFIKGSCCKDSKALGSLLKQAWKNWVLVSFRDSDAQP